MRLRKAPVGQGEGAVRPLQAAQDVGGAGGRKGDDRLSPDQGDGEVVVLPPALEVDVGVAHLTQGYGGRVHRDGEEQLAVGLDLDNLGDIHLDIGRRVHREHPD
ncbi:hypothetical protein RY27_13295, partial [Litorilinea aerophila]